MPTFTSGFRGDLPRSEGPGQPAVDLDVYQSAPITVEPGEVTILPYPFPGPGETAGSPGRVLIVAGTEGDDVLNLPTGAAAAGGAGADTFVLTSAGDQAIAGEPERLGVIFDFDEEDSLDLSQLGEQAAIIGRAADLQAGIERVSIDYDGDGNEDGYVLIGGKLENIGDDYPMPMPMPEGEFTILPYPMPGDDGVFTILPYPLPGEITSYAAADWVVA